MDNLKFLVCSLLIIVSAFSGTKTDSVKVSKSIMVGDTFNSDGQLISLHDTSTSSKGISFKYPRTWSGTGNTSWILKNIGVSKEVMCGSFGIYLSDSSKPILSFWPEYTTNLNGKLGINLSYWIQPSYPLDVNGVSQFKDTVILKSSSSSEVFKLTNLNKRFSIVQFDVIPRILIDSTGNVGLGTNAPAVKLDVHGNVHFGGNGGDIYTSGAVINSLYNYDAEGGELYINYAGYNGSTTRSRDLFICDGKNNPVLFIDGSTRVSKYYGGIEKPISGIKTTTYAVLSTDYTIICNPSGGTFDADLLQASSCPGRILCIVNIDGSNNVQVDPYAGDTVNGNDPLILGPNSSVIIHSDGTSKWYLISYSTWG